MESPSAAHATGNRLAEGLSQRAEQRHRAVIVLDVGRVHLQGKDAALRIGHDVALAPHHLLMGVKPARAATFRGLDGLTVDDGGLLTMLTLAARGFLCRGRRGRGGPVAPPEVVGPPT